MTRLRQRIGLLHNAGIHRWLCRSQQADSGHIRIEKAFTGLEHEPISCGETLTNAPDDDPLIVALCWFVLFSVGFSRSSSVTLGKPNLLWHELLGSCCTKRSCWRLAKRRTNSRWVSAGPSSSTLHRDALEPCAGSRGMAHAAVLVLRSLLAVKSLAAASGGPVSYN